MTTYSVIVLASVLSFVSIFSISKAQRWEPPKTIEQTRTAALMAIPEPPENCANPNYTTKIPLDPPSFKPTDLEAARKAALDRHNYYRALHNVPPLKRSPDLDGKALHVAECNVKWGQGKSGLKGVLPKPKRGENLYWDSSPKAFNLAEAAVKFVDAWYSELCLGTKENIAHKKFNSSQWHFTQMVWKSTTELGIGFAGSSIGGKKFLFMVGRYLPIGNSFWEFDLEVGTLKMADNEMCCRAQGKLVKDVAKGSDCVVKVAVTPKPKAAPEIPANCERVGQKVQFDLEQASYPPNVLAAARKAALDRHNYYRNLHGAPPLKTSPELESVALHAAECNVKWGQGRLPGTWGERTARRNQGEILFSSSSWGPTGRTRPFNLTHEAERIVDHWYAQYCKGDKDTIDRSKWLFNQLIWKSTTQFGIGFSTSTDLNKQPGMTYRYIFSVARYTPEGDHADKYDTEIGKLKIADDEICCRSQGKLRKQVNDCPKGSKGRSLTRALNHTGNNSAHPTNLTQPIGPKDMATKEHELRMKVLAAEMETWSILKKKAQLELDHLLTPDGTPGSSKSSLMGDISELVETVAELELENLEAQPMPDHNQLDAEIPLDTEVDNPETIQDEPEVEFLPIDPDIPQKPLNSTKNATKPLPGTVPKKPLVAAKNGTKPLPAAGVGKPLIPKTSAKLAVAKAPALAGKPVATKLPLKAKIPAKKTTRLSREPRDSEEAELSDLNFQFWKP